MTDQEFKRYQKAFEIKDKINNLEHEIEYLNSDLVEHPYPRTESNWCLSITLNDSPKLVRLSSEYFWKCMDLVIQLKKEELDNYKKEFDEL